ncbi:MAG: hypothetical protein ACLRNA_03795 [Gemmiger formicilis]
MATRGTAERLKPRRMRYCRGVEDAALQLPAVMMRVDASIDPYNRGATQCLTA